MKNSKKILLLAILTLTFSGCIGTDAALERPRFDANLPKPKSVKSISSYNSIGLEWDFVDNPNIAGYFIYRSANEGKLTRIMEISDRFVSHFVDKGLDVNKTYFYRVSAYDIYGVESEATETVAINTLPTPDKVSFVSAVNNLPERAKIVWRPHGDSAVNGYIIQKFDDNSNEWKNKSEIGGRLSAEYIEKDVKSATKYRYRVIAKTYDLVLSEPSDGVTVSTKGLPQSSARLMATTDEPKRITLIWERAGVNTSHYLLYRSKNSEDGYERVAKTVESSYTDIIEEDGAVRFYKLSSVDKDSLESPKSDAVKGQTRAKPATPVFTKAAIQDNFVVLSWNSADSKVVKFRITKKSGNFLTANGVVKDNISGSSFIDKDVALGVTYRYSIEGIDEKGLASAPSQEVELFVPKGN